MDKDRIADAAKRVSGSMKEVIAKVTGKKSTQVKGAAERSADKVQSTAGQAKDSAQTASKK